MERRLIVAGARTPIGKLSGGLGALSAAELGGKAIEGALHRADATPKDVGYVVMGEVLQAGAGQDPARQAAVNAGVPMEVPATTINKVCLSGINAIHLADLMIGADDADFIVAGGMESMTNAPHLLRGARAGYRYGSGELEDVINADGLLCSFEHIAMGATTERDTESAKIDRASQDEIALWSHERAANGVKSGKFAEEIVPVSVPQRRGEPVLIEHDEGIRPGTTLESLGRLAPAFSKGGSITAGNVSQISDGACALVVTSKARADRLGTAPLGEIISFGQVAGPDTSLLTQPSRAIRVALDRAGMKLSDIDLFEINEAFAAVAVASIADLGVSSDVVNVNGGAIALGHPIGMSGARLVLSLLYELRRRGGGIGVAALCGGGGQGDALIVRSLG